MHRRGIPRFLRQSGTGVDMAVATGIARQCCLPGCHLQKDRFGVSMSLGIPLGEGDNPLLVCKLRLQLK